MSTNCRKWTVVVALAIYLSAFRFPLSAFGQLPPSWQAPKPDDVKKAVFAWLDGRKPDAAARAKADAIWAAQPHEPSGVDLLKRVVETFALADENARTLLALTSTPRDPKKPQLPTFLFSPKTQDPRPKTEDPTPKTQDPRTDASSALGLRALVLDNNLRLWYGRWLVQESLYDEALDQLVGLTPEGVVDPATLLFCQAVVNHRLLNQEPGLEAIGRLLAGADQGPRRYAVLARLMEGELKDLREDSLDHIARRMQDIERRLDLGRAGPKVRGVEDGVVKSLDKLIEELERQQQQQQSSGGAGGNNIQSVRPASDSLPMGGKGRGDVTKRNVGDQTGWGDLPPRQREEAMQQIGRQFPSHYRDVIEQYFRKLATEER
jgi:hypothetical protein